MRCTLGTVAVTAVVLLALAAFWPPDAGVNLPPRVVAQDQNAPEDAGPAAPETDGPVRTSSRDETISRVESKLDKRINVDFVEIPLADVLEFVGEAIGVDILLNHRSLEDESIPTDAPVTLRIKHTTISARTALDVVLEQLGLEYVIRDGFIYVVTRVDAEEDMYIEVYNIGDLLEGVAAGRDDAEHTAGPAVRVPLQTVQFGDVDETRYDTPGGKLIAVVEHTVRGPWESVDGTGGTIEEFNGMLIARTTRRAHREVKDLLAMMRSAQKEQPPRVRAHAPEHGHEHHGAHSPGGFQSAPPGGSDHGHREHR